MAAPAPLDVIAAFGATARGASSSIDIGQTIEGIVKFNLANSCEQTAWEAYRKVSDKEHVSSASQRSLMGEKFRHVIGETKTALVLANALFKTGDYVQALEWWTRAMRILPHVKHLGHGPALAFLTVICTQYATELGSSRLNAEVFMEQSAEWLLTSGITEVSETTATHRLAEFCREGLREPSNFRGVYGNYARVSNPNNQTRKPFNSYTPYGRGGRRDDYRRDDNNNNNNNNNRGSNNNNNRSTNNNYRESGRNSARGPLAITNGSGGRREAMKGGNPSAPDCRDFKLGKCTRAVCSFKH
jgi:hypothetical protein